MNITSGFVNFVGFTLLTCVNIIFLSCPLYVIHIAAPCKHHYRVISVGFTLLSYVNIVSVAEERFLGYISSMKQTADGRNGAAIVGAEDQIR